MRGRHFGDAAQRSLISLTAHVQEKANSVEPKPADVKRVRRTPSSGAGDRFSCFKCQNWTRTECRGDVLVMDRSAAWFLSQRVFSRRLILYNQNPPVPDVQWRPRTHTPKIFSHLKWEIRPRGESGRVYLVVAKIACFGLGRNEKMASEGCGGK